MAVNTRAPYTIASRRPEIYLVFTNAMRLKQSRC